MEAWEEGERRFSEAEATGEGRGRTKKALPEVGFEPTRTYAQQILSLPP